jgi:hypothetical protein
MSAHLALGAAAALAGLSALRAGSGSRSLEDRHRLLDLPDDMIDIVPDGLCTLGVDISEAQRLIKKNPILRIKMQPMDLLWSKVRHRFPGSDLQGAPADLWTEKHWDYRGPPHVVQLHHFLLLLLPTHADQRDPERIRDRLLSGDVEPRWGQDLLARTWEDADRDMEVVVGLRRRSAPTPASIGTIEGVFNLPPAIFIEGDFWDGRHRLFAARLAGLSHFPVIDLIDLVEAP